MGVVGGSNNGDNGASKDAAPDDRAKYARWGEGRSTRSRSRTGGQTRYSPKVFRGGKKRGGKKRSTGKSR